MKRKTPFLMASSSCLALSLLTGCIYGIEPGDPVPGEPKVSKPLEVGDTLKKWTSPDDFYKGWRRLR